jgi:hypothetical protein
MPRADDAYHAARVAERKREERRRSRESGWSYVTVRLPPGAHEEILDLAALRRDEYLRGEDA